LTLLVAVALWFGVHWAYVIATAARARLNELTLYWKVMLAPVAVIGLLLDFAFNYTFGFMFVAMPKRHLFSQTVQHHFSHGDGWRLNLATFWARNLNVFDQMHIRQ
jgi:hypothetical protein